MQLLAIESFPTKLGFSSKFWSYFLKKQMRIHLISVFHHFHSFIYLSLATSDTNWEAAVVVAADVRIFGVNWDERLRGRGIFR